MVNLINKAYLFIVLWAAYGVFEIYQTSGEKIAGLKNDIALQERSIKKSKRSFKAIQEYLKNIDEKKKEIEQVAQEIETLQKQIPQKISDSENINLVRGIADSLKMRQLNINGAGEEERGFYISKKYNLKTQATYLQFLVFLEKLAESERILNVSGVEMDLVALNKKGRYVTLNINTTIEAYRYNPRHKEERGIKAIEKEFEKSKKTKKKSKKRNRRKKRRGKKKA